MIKNLIDHIGGTVERIVVTELIDNTFYAVIELNVNGEKSLLDSRPSDAIALALRTDAPIYVREDVLEHSARMIISSGPEGEEAEIERPQSEIDAPESLEWPDELDDDMTKYKM